MNINIYREWLNKEFTCLILFDCIFQVNHTSNEFIGFRKNSKRNVSTIVVKFEFQRQQGFYLLQVNGIVSLWQNHSSMVALSSSLRSTFPWLWSWCALGWHSGCPRRNEAPRSRPGQGWGPRLSSPSSPSGSEERVNLRWDRGKRGQATYSTLYYFYFFSQVDYATALDIFIILCFVNVFAALIEFALLNFLDTLVRRIKRKEQENKWASRSIGGRILFTFFTDHVTAATKKSLISFVKLRRRRRGGGDWGKLLQTFPPISRWIVPSARRSPWCHFESVER